MKGDFSKTMWIIAVLIIIIIVVVVLLLFMDWGKGAVITQYGPLNDLLKILGGG